MGIKSPLTNTLSLALGSSDVTLQEMVSSFGTLASGGVRTEPYFITKVVDKSGKVLENNLPVEKEVLSPQTSFVMTNLLQGVVKNGSGYAARQLGRPCEVKPEHQTIVLMHGLLVILRKLLQVFGWGMMIELH